MAAANQAPTPEDIRDAAARIAPFVHRTPVMTCTTLNRMADAELFFKCENLQKTGSFKVRGATNALLSLDETTAARGVATHSSGNHAAALAQAALKRGVPAHIVMPENAPRVKKDAVAGYGADITFCEPTLAAREQSLSEVIERTGASFIAPYNDYRIIAGQATAALEFLEDAPELDLIIAPVGGGGLLCGTALATHRLSPTTRILGAEPSAADDAFRSLRENRLLPSENPNSIADGLLTSLGDKTFPILRDHVAEILTCSEQGIAAAMRNIWQRMKMVVEPSAAVPLAALLENPPKLSGQRIGIIVSGGNVDLDSLPWGRKIQ